jgi:hypothetical protein
MFEQAYNTIKDRVDLLTDANQTGVVQLQPAKINFIDNVVERKADGSPDPQFVTNIHCAYSVKRKDSGSGTSVHLYFTQECGKIAYHVLFSNKTVFAGSHYADETLGKWVEEILGNFKAYAYVIARFMNVGKFS